MIMNNGHLMVMDNGLNRFLVELVNIPEPLSTSSTKDFKEFIKTGLTDELGELKPILKNLEVFSISVQTKLFCLLQELLMITKPESLNSIILETILFSKQYLT